MKKKVLLIISFVVFILGGGLWFYYNNYCIKTTYVNNTNTNPVSYTDAKFISELKSKYPQVYKHLDVSGEQSRYVIPGLEQTQAIIHSGRDKGKIGIAKDMDPQGIAIIENKYLLVSAYSKSKKFNSVLWLLDKKTGDFVKTIALDYIDHVGAITYDEEHHRLWVAAIDKNDDAQIEAMSLESIEK